MVQRLKCRLLVVNETLLSVSIVHGIKWRLLVINEML